MNKKTQAAVKNAFNVEMTESELNEYCQMLMVLALGTVRKLNGDEFAREFIEAGMSQKIDVHAEVPKQTKH